MAWGLKWQCCFQSFDSETQYAVNIYEQGYTGTVTQLTGADVPFETAEDSDDDIFTSVRTQSGYLRVIDTDGTLMEEIVPANNTQNLVRLMEGTYNNGFIGTTVKWQGFLSAQAYTQPWDGQAYKLELPLISVLGALNEIQIDSSMAGTQENVSFLLVQAMSQLGITPNNIYDYEDMFGEESHPFVSVCFPNIEFQWAIFFDKQEICNQGDSYEEYIGITYGEALEELTKSLNLVLREQGEDLYILEMSRRSSYYYVFSWANIVSMAENRGTLSYTSKNSTSNTAISMLNNLEFGGADNNVTIINGRRSVVVSLDIDTSTMEITLPNTTEDDTTPTELTTDNGILYTQIHEPRTLSYEFFSYWKYYQNTRDGETTYSDMLEHLRILGYTTNPKYNTDNPLVTGSFPVRYYFRPNGSALGSLRNGLYIQTQYSTGTGISTYSTIYELMSEISYTFTDGYININMLQQQLSGITNPQRFGNTSGLYYSSAIIEATIQLIILDENNDWWYWSGSEWTHRDSTISLRFDEETVRTNRTSDMDTDKTDGYFIPVSNMSGRVYLVITDRWYTYYLQSDSSPYQIISYARILSNLTISYVPKKSLVASSRGSNTYREQILLSGFKNDETTSLKLGTINNNEPSCSFLMGAYVSDGNVHNFDLQESTYYNGPTSYSERIELHLLRKMAEYYNQSRRCLTAIVKNAPDLNTSVYAYNDRNYVGFYTKRDWRNQENEIKFLEINKYDE